MRFLVSIAAFAVIFSGCAPEPLSTAATESHEVRWGSEGDEDFGSDMGSMDFD